MEENKKEIVEETIAPKEGMESEANTPPVAESTTQEAEKKPARQRKTAPKKTAVGTPSPDIAEKTPVLRLKPSLRHGFQLKGRYYSRTELGRKSVLEKLYKQYPGLFEK